VIAIILVKVLNNSKEFCGYESFAQDAVMCLRLKNQSFAKPASTKAKGKQ